MSTENTAGASNPPSRLIETIIPEEFRCCFLSDLTSLPAISGDGHEFKFDLKLSERAKEVAFRELRETDEIKEIALKQLRELLKEEKGLKVPIDNDAWLIRFLRPCKYYPESAFKLIQQYFKFKVDYAHIFDGLTPSKQVQVLSHNLLTIMPQRNQLGQRVLIIENGRKWNYKKCPLVDIFKGCVMLSEAALLEPDTQILGVVNIFNMDGMTMGHVMQFTPSLLKLYLNWFQYSIPMRIKHIHIINQPKFYNVVYKLMKPFLNKKLTDRIVLHGNDRASLLKYINPECLFEEHGGTLDFSPITGQEWIKVLNKFDREFVEINSYGYGKE